MNASILICRFFLLVAFGAGLWMMDCAGEFSVARAVKEVKAVNGLPPDLKKALGGCRGPEVPVQLTGSLSDLALLLPMPADRAEFKYGLARDNVFIVAYTCGYLTLVALLWQRTGKFPQRILAVIAFLLTLLTAACDVGENRFTQPALDLLAGDYRQATPVEQRAFVNDDDKVRSRDTLRTKQRWSYAKWFAHSADCTLLAFVFLHRRRWWQNLAGGLLLVGGLCGLFLGAVQPRFIEYSLVACFLGSLVGTIILLGAKNVGELWE